MNEISSQIIGCSLRLEEHMKKQIFCKCDKCIGITPCKVLKDGRIMCEYCNDEVTHLQLKHSSSETEIPHIEQHI
jgi:hypothetical protein